MSGEIGALAAWLKEMESLPFTKHPPVVIRANPPFGVARWSFELDANGKVVSTKPPLEPMNDPYLDQSTCVARLIREWEKHRRLIVAVDFDDSVYPFHDTGHTHERVIALVKECSDLGWHIVVFTASDPARYPLMRDFLKEKGIEVTSINVNPIELPFGNWGKVYYNVLLDDRAGLRDAYEQLRQVVDHVKERLAERDRNLSADCT